jgi:hypothetical protein
MKITSDSHLDHGLTLAHVEWLKSYFAERSAFFIETVEIPDDLPPVPCALFGPEMGDERIFEADVTYVVRGGRRCCSRVLKFFVRTELFGSLPRTTRKLTIVAGPHGDEPCVLYTSYGGPQAPREPGDPTIGSWEEIEKSRAFWQAHALSGEDV